MVAFWWAFSVISYIIGAGISVKRVGWFFVDKDYCYSELTDLEEEWILVALYALLWPACAPPTLFVLGIRRTIIGVGLGRWFNSKPMPRAERKSLRKRERLDKLNDAIKAAEVELAKVNANLRSLQAGPVPEPAIPPPPPPPLPGYKYEVLGHRGS